MIKADLHIHTNLDPKDGLKNKNNVTFSPYELIDKAAKNNFTHLSLTHHEEIKYPLKVKKYAQKKDINLIKGVEALIEGKELLLYNINTVPKTFDELKRMKSKNKNIFVIAPHPYYPLRKALKSKLEEIIYLVDAIEICSLHHPLIFIYNKRAKKIANKYNIPLVATSDTHVLDHFGRNYIYSKDAFEKENIFDIIKQRKFQNITPRIKTKTAIKIIKKSIKKKLNLI